MSKSLIEVKVSDKHILQIHALEELRIAVSKRDETEVLSKIGKCLRIGANISMILATISPLLPPDQQTL